MKKQIVLIIDFGGQCTGTVARKVRELGVFCEIFPYKKILEKIKKLSPAGIIASGEPDASKDEDAPGIEADIAFCGVPLLEIFNEDLQKDDFNEKIEKFLFKDCRCSKSWSMKIYKEAVIKEIKDHIGEKRVLQAFSGGVDSSVLAALLSKSIGDRLVCIFVDHGFMRKNEGDEVEAAFSDWGINLIRVDARERFLSSLAGVEDPEKKRKIIGEEFIRVFEEAAEKLGHFDYLAQGTIYTDVMESGATGSAVVKSHHNVGGLPKNIEFDGLVEPLKMLFKSEVKELGKELGLAQNLIERQTFPGPGLAVRIIGEVTQERLTILQEADSIFREEIELAKLGRDINMYFAVLTPIRSVGFSGERRTYDYTLALRAVTTTDVMSAEFARIPYDILAKVSDRIIKEVEGINRVVYDVTDKPPSTIEWE